MQRLPKGEGIYNPHKKTPPPHIFFLFETKEKMRAGVESKPPSYCKSTTKRPLRGVETIGTMQDPNIFLPIENFFFQGKTLASKPGVPENVTAQTVSNSSIHLSWYPAYPRTGSVIKSRDLKG